jgi:spore coat protein CotH
MRRVLLLLLALLGAVGVWWSLPRAASPTPPVAPPAGARKGKPLPGAEIFNQPTLLAFRIELSPEALNALRREPRRYAAATVTVDGRVFTNVAIHLKGAAGSFRGVDDRPALTVCFNKFVAGRKLFGLRKIHLNNSVQDDSFMNEYVASDLFRAADVPTPRVAFSTVEFDTRKLGLYVLKEGFSEDFLKCHFKRTDGNLYDGGFLQDVDQPLELDEGKGVRDRSDLKALTAAANEPNRAKRWERLQQTLDVDRFVAYAAVSVMLGDWDGYLLNRNNYRVYFNPADGRAVFLPHGLDQMFQRTDMDVFPGFNGLVAQGLFDTPEGRQLYEERFRALFFDVFRFERMTNAMARVAEVLRPVQPDIDQRASSLRHRIAARIRFLGREPLLKPPPPPIQPAFSPTPATTPAAAAPTAAKAPNTAAKPTPPPAIPLTNWQPAPNGDARLEQSKADGRAVLKITASNHSTASWRATVRVQAGRYRLEGKVRGAGIQAVRDDKGEGAGLRVSGFAKPRANKPTGDAGWTPLAYEFEVKEADREVTCVCELRATKGQVLFDRDSLRVVPLAR